MHQLQRSWVRSQHPSAQWNLRGGRWNSANIVWKKTKKSPKKIFKKNILTAFMFIFLFFFMFFCYSWSLTTPIIWDSVMRLNSSCSSCRSIFTSRSTSDTSKGFKRRLNMEVDLQSVFGLHVTWCAQLYSLAETPQPSPRIWPRITRALLVSKDTRHPL